MATLTPLKVTETGVGSNIGTAYADTNGDEFSNTGIEFLRIRNDYSAPYTVRVTAQTTSISHPTYGAVTKANTDVIVTNGTDAYIGPFKQGVWGGRSMRSSLNEWDKESYEMPNPKQSTRKASL